MATDPMTVDISLECGASAAVAYKTAFEDAELEQTSAMSGEPAYILMASLVVGHLPVIVTQLSKLVDNLPIRRATIDGKTFTNLTKTQLQQILSKMIKASADE